MEGALQYISKSNMDQHVICTVQCTYKTRLNIVTCTKQLGTSCGCLKAVLKHNATSQRTGHRPT
uniref:Uncharacterized protein n=1 Tax=Anguilla anguilla TaxID=7936 RepID=A0A0E9VBF9_ANGAN